VTGLLTQLRNWLGFKPSTGRSGERAGVQHLKRSGYRILGRNLRSRLGEIDILALTPEGRTLVVVEVKATALRAPAAGDCGGVLPPSPGGAVQAPAASERILPEMHVNHAKQRKLAALASHWSRRLRLTHLPVRFDVIGVDLPAKGKPVIRHYEGAFESPY
jgi:putative endonuclease